MTTIDSISIKIMMFIQVWDLNEIVDMKVNKRNWLKMQDIDKIKKLKTLILKNKCLKEQSQSFDNDDYNWFRQFFSIKIIKLRWF